MSRYVWGTLGPWFAHPDGQMRRWIDDSGVGIGSAAWVRPQRGGWAASVWPPPASSARRRFALGGATEADAIVWANTQLARWTRDGDPAGCEPAPTAPAGGQSKKPTGGWHE